MCTSSSQSVEPLRRQRQRIRWWSALALLRSVASSPAAAAMTLRTRAIDANTPEEADAIGQRAVLDLVEDEPSEGADVWLARYIPHTVEVAVPRGENAGSTLEHTAIARELRVAGPVPPQGGAVPTIVRAPAGVAPADLRIVAFVQERASRRVLGTGTRALVAGP